MEKTKALTTQTSLYSKPNKAQQEVTAYFVKELGLSQEQARELVTESKGKYEGLLKEIKRKIDFRNIELISKLQEGLEEKVKKGSMEQAKAAALAISILSDKTFGSQDKPVFNVGGKEVTLNLAWKPKWMERKEKLSIRDKRGV